MEWYVSNPRTPEAIYPDEVLDLVTKEEEEDDSASEGSWSGPTCSNASRLPSPQPSSLRDLPPSLHPPPSLKRKASDNVVSPRKTRKGSKRSKPVRVMSKAASTMPKLPPNTPETRQAINRVFKRP